MGTPRQVCAVAPARRHARVILDRGGLLIAVDGSAHDLVDGLLSAAMAYTSPAARVHRPSTLNLAPPLCVAYIAGTVSPLARVRVLRMLADADYLVD